MYSIYTILTLHFLSVKCSFALMSPQKNRENKHTLDAFSLKYWRSLHFACKI